MSCRRSKRVTLIASWFATLTLLATTAELQAVMLHPVRSAATDLQISGLLEDVPEGESRWIRWNDIRDLPSQIIETEGEFLAGRQEVRIVLLQDLMDRLPVANGADTVLADCADGYTSVFTHDFRSSWKPYIVVTINGQGPAAWPLPGMNMDPGPYVVSVSEEVVPGVDKLMDVAHKRPWATTGLRFVHYADEFAAIRTGEWQSLSESATRGRELWVNSCHSCHTGPDGITGGSKSGRPFAVLKAHASFNRDWFVDYVRNPATKNPAALMTPHPHYSDSQFSDLIAFILAETPVP